MTDTSPRHYLIATGTRADWGLLSPLARRLRRDGNSVTVAATNMHLMQRYGMTVSEIEADGFTPLRVPAEGNPAQICAAVTAGFDAVMEQTRYDAVVILGDRYEMLAVAQAAVLRGVPVIHIAGGAVSFGAYDDGFRHAITKLSTLHLTETDDYRRRILQLGEDPAAVVTTGAIGLLQLADTADLMSRTELEASLGFDITPGSLLVTLHPATLSPLSPHRQMLELLDALDRFPENQILFTYPNNDHGGAEMIALIEEYSAGRPGRVHVVPSLGHRRYLSALQYVAAVVGNSSSGLVEVPSAGIPTLDIGCRQEGRTAGPSVVHCGETAEEIACGLGTVLSPQMRETAARRENPYFRADVLERMARAIADFDFKPYPVKRFNDIR